MAPTIRLRNGRGDISSENYPADSLVVFQLPFNPPIYHPVLNVPAPVQCLTETPDDERDADCGRSSVSVATSGGSGSLRLPVGSSGRAPFARACKAFDGKWVDAEYAHSHAVEKGAGIPGRLAVIPRSKLPKELLEEY